MRVVYLHGFASSPRSSKAQFFRSKLEQQGVEVEIPALDNGDFEHLTITGQLEVIERTVAGRPATLFGSSMGGYLAALYAARHPEIERLVLLAPAFQFPKRWRERYTPEQIDTWRRIGSAPVYHYGFGEQRLLSYGLMEDSTRYENEPDFAQPALIFHGNEDPVVPVAYSEQFAAIRPNVTLEILPSGHELTDVLDPMWTATARFLGLVRR